MLENNAGGLIEISGQGLVFVRPGGSIEFDTAEDLENYPRERLVGDWVLDALWLYIFEFDLPISFTNADIMSGSITGDDRLILSFDDGILYEVSEKLEMRVPITRYLDLGRGRMYFENPQPLVPYVNRFLAYVLPADRQQGEEEEMIIEVFPIPDGPVNLVLWFSLKRITALEQSDPSEGGN